MLDEIEERLYTNLPHRLQPIAQKWYYVANPRLSWSQRKKPEEVDETFVDRFFDDVTEFERYRDEFAESGIVDICQEADERTPEGYTIFDTHRKDAMKYYTLVRKRQPETLIETGTYNGVSTLSMLLALSDNGFGRLYSVDNSQPLRDRGDDYERRRYYERGRPSCSEPGSSLLVPDREPGWIIPADLHEFWSLTRGRSSAELPGLLAEVGAVDLFVHDSEHSVSRMLFEFELAWEGLDEGGMLLTSHMQWNDAFDTFVREHDCDHGLLTFHYLGYEGEKVPCSTGYAIKA